VAEICDDVKTRIGIFTVLDVEQMCGRSTRHVAGLRLLHINFTSQLEALKGE
jgi:hypothetical protein